MADILAKTIEFFGQPAETVTKEGLEKARKDIGVVWQRLPQDNSLEDEFLTLDGNLEYLISRTGKKDNMFLAMYADLKELTSEILAEWNPDWDKPAKVVGNTEDKFPKAAFVVFGHGSEKPVSYSERDVMPPGYALVTFTEYGTPAYHNEAYPIYLDMEANPDKYTKFPVNGTPEEIKAATIALGPTARVYTEGMPYPNLTFVPLAHSHIAGPKRYSTDLYSKSGVHKLPIKNDDYSAEYKTLPDGSFHHLETNTYWGAKTITPDIKIKPRRDLETAFEMFDDKSRVFPSDKEIHDNLQLHDTKEDSKIRSYHLKDDLFKALGPGVYYWTVCRSIPGLAQLSLDTDNTRARSNARQRTLRGLGRRGNRRSRRNRRKTYRKPHVRSTR